MRVTRARSARRVPRDLVALTLAAAAAAIALDASAAFNAFAKFGDIKGESTDDKHKDESDVLSWSWGVVGEAKKPGCGLDLNLTKSLDSASPKLVETMAMGKSLPTARLTVRKSIIGPDYLIITLTNAVVLNVSPSGSSNGETFEHVALGYETATMTYKVQAPDGSLGAELTAKVDGCPN